MKINTALVQWIIGLPTKSNKHIDKVKKVQIRKSQYIPVFMLTES